MAVNDFLEFLETQKLREKSEKYAPLFEKVLQTCLNLKDEKLLIITDYGTEKNKNAVLLSGAYILAAKKLGIDVDVAIQGPRVKIQKAESTVIKKLNNLEEKNAIAVVLSKKLGKLNPAIPMTFRKFVKKNKHRFVSTTHLAQVNKKNFDVLMDSINVDYEKMKQHAFALKEKLDYAKEINVKTKAGTDLWMKLKPKSAIPNTGLYRTPISGGNLPAGEVYVPTFGKHSEGKVVIDGSISIKEANAVLIKKPVTLTIEKGKIVEIDGEKEAEKLKQTIGAAFVRAKYPWGIKRLAELGIGINPNAKICGPTIINEKTLGTAHVANGSNAWFGGSVYAVVHLDHVFKNPEIYLDNKKLDI